MYNNLLKIFIFSTFLLIISSKISSLNPLPKYPSIYQISTRPFLYELSQKSGKEIKTLAEIPDSVFEEIKQKKFDFVWFMGVWQIGEYGIKHDRTKESLIEQYKKILPDYTEEDAIGCPYAITDYICNKELCPNGDEDLLNLKKRLNDMGIRLMLDFVPNHLALDSPYVDEDIDYFIRAPKDMKPPYDKEKYYENGVAYGGLHGFDDRWTDVAQINYYNPKSRSLMLSLLKKVAKFSDGIRCDVAWVMLNDFFYKTWHSELDSWGWSKPQEQFWESAIKEVKAEFPDLKLLAEVYGNYFGILIQLGFDYTYDKEMLDKFAAGNVGRVKAWARYTEKYGGNVCRFMENHDDNRATALFNNHITITDLTALTLYTLPGVKFYFQGQFFGLKNKLDVHLRRAKAEEIDQEAATFYEKLFTFINDDLFRNGEFKFLTPKVSQLDNTITYLWKGKNSEEKVLFIINYSNINADGTVALLDLKGKGKIILTEIFSGKEYEEDIEKLRSEGLKFNLNGWSGMALKFNN